MPSFGVRSIIQWLSPAPKRKKYVYEERITLWNASSAKEAIEFAEIEADAYIGSDARRLGLLQVFWLFDDLKLKKQGIEVFSLLRESDLAPKAYLNAFFDTGFEQDIDDAEAVAHPQHRRRRNRIPQKRQRR